MSKAVDELKRKTLIRLCKEEIETYKNELRKIPWYTFDKEKRKYRGELKQSLKELERFF